MSNTHTGVWDVDPMDRQERSVSYLGRSDLMPLATGFARSSDVKSEVSRGHSRGDLKGRTLTTRVEVTTLMTNSSEPQNNVLEGGCHDAKRAEQRSVVSDCGCCIRYYSRKSWQLLHACRMLCSCICSVCSPDLSDITRCSPDGRHGYNSNRQMGL